MPVALERFANGAQTTLNGAVTNVATSIVVASATGFPAQVTSPIQFHVLVDTEIMVVTGGFGTATWTVTRGAEGTTAAAHASGATVSQLVTQGALERWTPNYVPFTPWQQGLVLANFDPLFATATLRPGAGTIFLSKMWVPETVLVSNMLMYVTTAGATLTAGQNLAGIYSQAGTLLASTADQSAAWTSTGLKTMALTGAPVSIPGGPDVFVWAAVLTNGTTGPTWQVSTVSNVVTAGQTQGAVPGANIRMGFESAGGRTSLVSLNGLTVNGFTQAPWAGCT